MVIAVPRPPYVPTRSDFCPPYTFASFPLPSHLLLLLSLPPLRLYTCANVLFARQLILRFSRTLSARVAPSNSYILDWANATIKNVIEDQRLVREMQKEDPGAMVQTGYTASSQSAPLFAWRGTTYTASNRIASVYGRHSDSLHTALDGDAGNIPFSRRQTAKDAAAAAAAQEFINQITAEVSEVLFEEEGKGV
ncbi:hypothetical protein NUW54_g2912 [Trametes sanguinea]|uniref:Uncharacterized protein n=2 Tax=Trametes sanguinea TaxID=158606 RepID=A0ACC1PZZ2_9APHY|nr:hypothetical protein NUW54_g4474 [Trametes sanguinea]KAJ3009091.1 hypothetical protein NUW54_g2912 [Trametes sanguinea]